MKVGARVEAIYQARRQGTVVQLMKSPLFVVVQWGNGDLARIRIDSLRELK